MSLERKRLEVTDRIVGKMANGEIHLFLDQEKVGSISLAEGSQIQLEHHFETDEQQRIFQHVSTPGKDEPRYTDCDEGGWC
ncbi:DUF2553 family protein [Bacillus sp. B15-48]|nr:DUF2553 family protein [Bacillus sp. B15-48]